MFPVSGGWFWSASRRVLEDAFRAGVMNELPAGHQSFVHGYLAPGAEAVRNVSGGRLGTGSHGPAFSPRVANLVNRPHRGSNANFF
jgi:hypothetical protein